MTDNITGIPKAEKRREHYDLQHGEYIVTSKNGYGVFFLYKVENGRATKIMSAKNSNEFREVIFNERIHRS